MPLEQEQRCKFDNEWAVPSVKFRPLPRALRVVPDPKVFTPCLHTLVHPRGRSLNSAPKWLLAVDCILRCTLIVAMTDTIQVARDTLRALNRMPDLHSKTPATSAF